MMTIDNGKLTMENGFSDSGRIMDPAGAIVNSQLSIVNSTKTLVFVVGPTGSGKTDLSIALARHFGAPVLSADSRQFYRGMAIGTAQPTTGQLAAAEHHFIASHDITEQYSCGRYEADALELLARLFERHPVVVAVGGSGLYVDALCHGMDSLPDADPELRERLVLRLADNGLDSLLAELQRLDPEYYDKVDRGNPQRIGLVPAATVLFRYIVRCNEMVFGRGQLFRGGLDRTDRHPAIELPRVGREYRRAEVSRQSDTQIGLARPGRPDHEDQGLRGIDN